MTQKEIEKVEIGDEFYFIRNTRKLSYHKCIVVSLFSNGNSTYYTLTYLIKGSSRINNSVYRGVPNDGQIFFKKIDMLLYAKSTNRKLTQQVEDEITRSLEQDAEYWV